MELKLTNTKPTEGETLGQVLRTLAENQRQAAELQRQQAAALAVLAGSIEQAIERASKPTPVSVLHDSVELRLQEAAQVVGLTPQAVMQRLRRGSFPQGLVPRGKDGQVRNRVWRMAELLEWAALPARRRGEKLRT